MADEGNAQQEGAEPSLSERREQRRQGEEDEGDEERELGLGDVPTFPPFVGRPVAQTARRYLEPRTTQAFATSETPPAPSRDRRRDERFRREVFELFEAARGLLSRWTIGRYLREYRDPRQNTTSVVRLDNSATAGDGLRLLAQANILSAPVVDTKSLMVR